MNKHLQYFFGLEHVIMQTGWLKSLEIIRLVKVKIKDQTTLSATLSIK